jgi:hypothetical protein
MEVSMDNLISFDKDDLKRNYIKDDPVRSHLDFEWRFTNGRQVFGLETEYGAMRSVVCVAYTNGIGIVEEDLNNTEDPDTAMFYTVWSYDKGAGRDIIFSTAEHIKRNYPHIKRFVTLSPLTEMAEKFHLRNGAKLLRKGKTCQNFEYTL